MMTISELVGRVNAELARPEDEPVTTRTVRYYIAEGLLPPGSMSGSISHYGHEHFVRLKLIRHLCAKDLSGGKMPLGEIRRHLQGLSLAEMEELVEKAAQLRARATSSDPMCAKDLLGAVLFSGSPEVKSQPSQDATERARRQQAKGKAGERVRRSLAGSGLSDTPSSDPILLRQLLSSEERTGSELGRAGSNLDGSQGMWRRVVIAPGVELHYEAGLERTRLADVEMLIREALRILCSR